MKNFPDKIIIDAPPAWREAIQRRIVEECSAPAPQTATRRPTGGRGANWTPPPAPAGYDGLIPQNDADWLAFAGIMFPRWSENTARKSIGAWKKRIYDSPGWLDGWQESHAQGWAQWVASRQVSNT